MIEDVGSDEEGEEGSVQEGCIQHGEEDRERTLEEMKNRQGEAEQLFPEDPGLWPELLTKQPRDQDLSPLQLLNAIYNLQLQSIFGEICIALRIFYTLPVSVAGGERAFSKIKLVKNYLRSTMSQDRLNSLALLSVESQLARALDFKDLIRDFVLTSLQLSVMLDHEPREHNHS